MRKVIILVVALMPIVAMAQNVRKNAINIGVGGASGGIGINYDRQVASGKNVQLYVNGGFKKQGWVEQKVYNEYDNSWFWTNLLYDLITDSNTFSEGNTFEKGTLMNENIQHQVNTFTLGSNLVLAKYLEFGLTYRLDKWNKDISQTYHDAPNVKLNNSTTKHYIIPSMSVRYQTKNGLLMKAGIAKGVESNKISKTLIPNFSLGCAF